MSTDLKSEEMFGGGGLPKDLGFGDFVRRLVRERPEEKPAQKRMRRPAKDRRKRKAAARARAKNRKRRKK